MFLAVENMFKFIHRVFFSIIGRPQELSGDHLYALGFKTFFCTKVNII